MSGEKPTNKALQLAWQGTYGLADGIRQHSRCRVAVVGVGEAGSSTATQLTKMDIDARIMVITTGPLQQSALQTETIEDADVVFVTSGLASRTETRTALTIAKIAKKKGALTVGVVTKPCKPEKIRTKLVAHALAELRRECDTLVVIDNKKLLELAPQLPVDEAFKIADKVLANVIKGLIESISAHSLVNPDFADFKTIVKRGGVAGVGIGESDAPNRAEEAVRNALRSPLLDVDCTGATGTLIHVTGDSRLTLEGVNRVREIVAEMMNNNAQVILGAGVNPELDGKIRVTLMMTGVGPPQIARGFGSIAPQLFNLEPYSEPEKKLHVDLGLYQLENSEP